MNLSLKLILGVASFAGIGFYLTAQTATTALRGSISDPSGPSLMGLDRPQEPGNGATDYQAIGWKR